MPGHSKGKVQCGAILPSPVRCRKCGRDTPLTAPDVRTCQATPGCKALLPEWCRRKVFPGQRCMDHPGLEAHPEAATTLDRMEAVREQTAQSKLVRSYQDVPLEELAERMAKLMTAKAEITKAPGDIEAAARTLLNALKARDLS